MPDDATRTYSRPPAAAPTLLTLVRHGQTPANVARLLSGVTDDPLTPFGERQAAAMGTALVALVRDGTLPAVDALYVSPLQRARLTAAQIAAPLGLTPTVRADLSEVNFGEIEGLTEAQATERHPHLAVAFTDHPDAQNAEWPGGESRTGFRARVVASFTEIVAAHPMAHVVIVAHGGVLSAALAHYLAGDSRRWRDYLLGNCSLSRLTVAGDAVTLHCVNDLAHLADLTPEEAGAVEQIEARDDARRAKTGERAV